jgi:polyisoprenoid-binding protein YceI
MRFLRAAFASAALAFTGLAAPALAQGTQAPAGAYELDREHSSFIWQGLHAGLSWYTGRFTSFDAQLTFNPADVTKSKVTASIDPKSVETDHDQVKKPGDTQEFDKELANDPKYFNAGKFPKITFTSTSVTKTGNNTGRMTGNLTFLGVTKPVTLDVTYVGNRNQPGAGGGRHKVGFQAKGSFKRSDFGLTAAASMGDEIRIEINAEFYQKK